MHDEYDQDETLRFQPIDDSVIADSVAVVASQASLEPFDVRTSSGILSEGSKATIKSSL
jgi:hypothetical protein